MTAAESRTPGSITGPTDPASGSSPVGSVDKALMLLQILAAAGPEGMSLRDIAAESGLNKASVHRLLRALMHRGFADQSASDQQYHLGSAALDLTPAFGAGENLQTLFAPVLASISQRTQELVHLGQMDGTRVLYLDKVEPERTVRVWSRIGSRAPAARTAMGRAMLAADGVRAEALAAYAQATEGEETGTVISAAHLAEVLEQTAGRGWSAEVEENEAGIACVGVALTRSSGRSIAVSVTGPIERMGTARRAAIGQLLREELTRLAPQGYALPPRG
ncbi:IclR family transcriptional regulator [Brachybacterium avium]|uniref:IclR family transcriptional regulator n=1 Tax=Brachybacterium avium TaxID=2017485 RepID=A0A220UDC5_9MICO|nr:IclR family transcriptional regulator [Brachybacterium avium]ASK65926.1 IclR family transcriptional regulator [Brachybacterium avium]